MADRINDTDPQSPRALTARTDPGLGTGGPGSAGPPRSSPRPYVPDAIAELTPGHLVPLTPTPAVPAEAAASASIEELLDGITGPRPPPSSRPPSSRRDVPPSGARAYAAARPAPASRPAALPEPLVVSPDPPLYSGAGREPRDEDESTGREEQTSSRPVVRGMRAGEATGPTMNRGLELTVYTGKRAMLRNLAVVIASAGAVTFMMLSIMRWKESHRPPHSSEVVVMPAEPESEVPPQAIGQRSAAAAALVTAAPVPVVAAPPVAAVPAVTVPVTALPIASSAAKPAASAVAAKRAKGEAKPPSPASLDDLNREIRH